MDRFVVCELRIPSHSLKGGLENKRFKTVNGRVAGGYTGLVFVLFMYPRLPGIKQTLIISLLVDVTGHNIVSLHGETILIWFQIKL